MVRLGEPCHSGEEPGGAAPMLTVVSQAVARPLEDGSSAGRRRSLRLGTQLRAQRADVFCLQGMGAEAAGRALGSRYESVCGEAGEECVAIFWDRERFAAEGRWEVSGSAVSVELRLREDPGQPVRVASLRPRLGDCCRPGATAALAALLGEAKAPGGPPAALIVCADLGALGGAEAAALVPGLEGLTSAMAKAPGGEVACPRAVTLRPPPQRAVAAADEAAGAAMKEAVVVLRQLWRPSAVLCRGVCPAAALVGHTEGYLATLPEADVEALLPGGRLPLVVSLRLASEQRAPRRQ